jgi:protein-L-isoaspartate(D-aspartate) O-methyltransferase
MDRFVTRRNRMVQRQLKARGISDPRVLSAMAELPRERFVEPGMEEFAYEDSPLPIAENQTLSQPYIVGLMLQAAELQAQDHVLEVGAGSGYAAALMGCLVARVDAIERHPTLATQARARVQQLALDNVHVHLGDGSEGWPGAEPFDAILVAAGAPDIPRALLDQLAIGGRLVLPVGEEDRTQRLHKIRRISAEGYEDEDLGAVKFVPLVGAQGWNEEGTRAASSHRPGHAAGHDGAALVARAAEPLPPLEDVGFADVFERFADCRVVLLGECSHGTSEFYRARAAITRRLVEKHGFNIVAVEADWPDAAAINRHVRHSPARAVAEAPFRRFPTWMWRNTDVRDFVETLREINGSRDEQARCGFYGLDLYSLGSSIAAVLDYLDRIDPQAADVARERYGCLAPWRSSPASYGRAVLTRGYHSCEDAVVRQCRDLLQHSLSAGMDDEAALDATQNARLVAAAERYYRVMYYGGAESWNLRDSHMADTLAQLLEAKGAQGKAVVWAHNSHIGDARHTDMGWSREEHNIGQLCRERYGEDAALIGFGTHAGSVGAATDWDGDMQRMSVRPSREGSVERLCHDSHVERFLLDLRKGRNEVLHRHLAAPMTERFIGVIYWPDTELVSHYSAVQLAPQFDAYVWFDTTTAVTELGPRHAVAGAPETYPFGL